MKRYWNFGFLMGALFLLMVLAPALADARTSFERLVVFGDSLSDPGNLFALEGKAVTPPYDTLDAMLLPDQPYARGGHHFSNGATWIEQLAAAAGLDGNTRPAYRGSGEATNYAVGGARAYDDGINVNLSRQVTDFLNRFSDGAPGDALYVIEFGSNDIRDVLMGGDYTDIFSKAMRAIGDSIVQLHGAGARKFLICNAPDFGLTPVIASLPFPLPQQATGVSMLYNAQLEYLLASPQIAALQDIEIVRVDFFGYVNQMVASPAAFGLSVVNVPCIMPNTPPYACDNPDSYFFWDGAHPTRAVHGIIAQGVAALLAGEL